MRLILVFWLTIGMVRVGLPQKGPIQVVLMNDSIIFTNYASLVNQSGFLNVGPFVRINSKNGPKITIDKVNHVEGYDKNGVYKYFGVATFQNAEIFAERIHKGDRIDLYMNNVISGGWNFSYSNKLLHYVKDGGEMKKARYNNLKQDLRDSPEAMKKLRGGNAIKYTQYFLYALGTSVLINTIKKESEKPLSPPGAVNGPPTGFFVTAGLFFTPWLINGIKLKQYENAIKAYH